MKKPSVVSNILSTVIIVGLIMFSLHIYLQNINSDLQQSTELTLNEVSDHQIFALETFMGFKQSQLNVISNTISSMVEVPGEKYSQEEIQSYLTLVKDGLSVDNLFFLQPNGLAITPESIVSDPDLITEYEYQLQQMPTVSNTTYSSLSGLESVLFSSPVIDEHGNYYGAVVMETSCDNFSELLLSSFNNTGVAFLFDSTGEIIALSDNNLGLTHEDNLSKLLSLIEVDGAEYEGEEDPILNGSTPSGYLSYTSPTTNGRIRYNSLDNTDWTLVISVPEDAIARNANSIILNTTLLLIEIIAILIATWARVAHINKTHLKEISKIAYYDELTGLVNEKKFKLDIKQMLKRSKDKKFCIIKFDIVNFKVVNNIFGYTIGNKIIQAVAEYSTNLSSPNVLFCRISADEFLIFGLYDELANINSVRKIYETEANNNIRNICGRTFKFRYSRYTIPIGSTDADDIVNTITLTHSFCKTNPQAKMFDYDENLKNKLVETAKICNKMHSALENNEFKVYLQPKYNLSDASVYGAEALVRWQERNGNMLYPNSFIPVFEQEGFIVALDSYMLEQVCIIISRLREQSGIELPISINFSRMHMLQDNFADYVASVADKHNVPHHLIEIEMTETSMIDNEEDFKKIFLNLHKRGFTLSMDDFGAGYSSLALLSELSFDIIKLDRSLLSEATNKENSALVVKSILKMSKELKLKTVCEGVEKEEQINFLKDAGCDLAQGYFYSRPIPNEDFEDLYFKSNGKV